jgi:hypothetical protein
MPCSKVIVAISFVNIFLAHANIGEGSPNIGGGYSNKTRGHSNKTRQNKAIFCTNQHVANTKFAPKCAFCPKNALFRQNLRFLLLPNRYTHAQGDILAHLDYGLWVQNHAWEGHDIWMTSHEIMESCFRKRVETAILTQYRTFSRRTG